jgi:sugar lactone lactonase YvrE
MAAPAAGAQTGGPFSIEGSVSGLLGTGLVLKDSSGDTLPISGNGAFTFPSQLMSGSAYQITIQTQPTGPAQVCSVSNASGSVANGPVTNVEVTCQGGGSIALLAGALGGAGSLDGPGSDARFLMPSGLAVDPSGNLYVADTGNRTIRKISPAGLVSTLAGMASQEGWADGLGAAARFTSPNAVAVDAAGNVYVADGGVRKITSAGHVSTLAPMPLVASQQGFAASIAVDSRGTVYVIQTWAIPLVQITPAGLVSTPAQPPCAQSEQTSVAVDSADTLYIASPDGICKVAPSGLVTTVVGPPFAFWAGLSVDAAGSLYAAAWNDTIGKVTAAGAVSILAGSADQNGFVDGAASAARFFLPLGTAVDAAGNVYVADADNDAVRKITSAGVVSTLAGAAPQQGYVDGPGAVARFLATAAVAADLSGNVYVADADKVRKITPDGTVSTLAGASAGFQALAGIATDSAGNVYVSDRLTNVISRISPAGAVTSLAGSPSNIGPFDADGKGAAARFNTPHGIATDAAGNVYVADMFNEEIRKITPDGTVSTLAGMTGQALFKDGVGSLAAFNTPTAVVADSLGNVYVADSQNNAIRKVTPNGTVSTLAGGGPTAPGSADGTGTVARFNRPSGLAIDTQGTLYVADYGNNTIRRITPDGAVRTIAGTVGSRGVRLGPLPGSLNRPWSLAVLPGQGVALVVVGDESSDQDAGYGNVGDGAVLQIALSSQ